MLQLQQAGNDLVQRTVSAAGYHQVIVSALPGGGGGGVAGANGLVDPDQIAGLGENGDRVKQRAAGLIPPCSGVDQKEQLLRHKRNSFCLKLSYLSDSIARKNEDCNSNPVHVE